MSKIFISFGIPKSASSFLCQLAMGVTEKIIVEQRHVGKDATLLFPGITGSSPGFMYADSALDTLGLSRTGEGIDKLIRSLVEDMADSNEVIVVKTHQVAGPYTQKAIADGIVVACASIRHPADGLLSLMDHRIREGKEVTGIEQMIGANSAAVTESKMVSWLEAPNLQVFDFSDLVQFPHVVAQRIGALLGYSGPVRSVVDRLLDDPREIWQYNQGRLDRSKTELTAKQREEIEALYPHLMKRLNQHVPVRANPTFAVVIPSLNSVDHIGQAIQSIVNQTGDLDILLHIQDGGSTDGTRELIAQWRDHLLSSSIPFTHNITSFTWDSAPDTGMYHALQNGFDTLRADWYTWIGADNIFLPAAFQTVGTLSDIATEFDWVIGSTMEQREDGVFFEVSGNHINGYVSQRSIAMGLHDSTTLPFLQQEGIFWRNELWEQCGRHLPQQYKLAGDFALWTEFALHAEPLLVDYPLAVFRRRVGQLSGDLDGYKAEVLDVQSRLNREAAQTSDHQLQKAFVSYPRGSWKIDHVVPAPRTTEPLSARGRALPNIPSEAWDLSGTGDWEEPAPEIGLFEPFCWLLKAGATLTLKAPLEGRHKVTLSLANPHRNQILHIMGPGVDLKVAARNAKFVKKVFQVSFDCDVDPFGTDIRIIPSVAERTATDTRELGVLLTGIAIRQK